MKVSAFISIPKYVDQLSLRAFYPTNCVLSPPRGDDIGTYPEQFASS